MVTGDSQEEVLIFRDKQTHKHFIIIYINNININFKINVNVNVNIFISSVRVPKLSSFVCGKFDLA